MQNIDTIFLGVVQGLTEFLPVSSSGHLVLFQNLLGFREPELLLDCSLHFGTLLSVCLYFRSELKMMAVEIWQSAAMTLNARNLPVKKGLRVMIEKPHANLFLWVLVGSVPTGIVGLIFKTPIEELFGSVTLVGLMLIATGVIVASTRLIPEGHKTRTQVGLVAALAVGAAQGLAIMPGISRSGATIACGLLLGLERELAGRFSFFLSIPAIIGAVAIQLNAQALEEVGLVPLLLGSASSAIVGLFALKLLMGMVKKGHLYYFAPYCWALGLAAILM
ncbi:MAG: undecaprenyl-diphosphate phosphatase [Thermodesulfobacteriota bacterium]|nr:undecaprenyl-diphosphate phosphatase [Thermodesulfobacteriota bacterium]